jgi:hypothetical protein
LDEFLHRQSFFLSGVGSGADVATATAGILQSPVIVSINVRLLRVKRAKEERPNTDISEQTL